jgi:hypothetical protein
MRVPPTSPESLQRRTLLKKAAVAGGALWTLPTVDSFLSVAAAASATVTVPLVKTLNGNSQPDPPLPELCTTGGTGNSVRGSAVWVRNEGPPRICVTITLSTGVTVVNRQVYILQSNGSGCVGGTVTKVGDWSAAQPGGPQTFCTPILAGATSFVVALIFSGGLGVDGFSSHVATLP